MELYTNLESGHAADAIDSAILQFYAAPAVTQHQRGLAAQESSQRLADEVGSPARGETARPVLQHLRELGSRREQ
jgi:hypothetical protein